MGAVTSKVRLYDLAKELKIDTKRLIEEVRREGVDVSVPSNSVSKELAEKIRDKYFPKKDATVKRAVKVVKKAARTVVEEVPLVEEEEVVEDRDGFLLIAFGFLDSLDSFDDRGLGAPVPGR